MVIRYSDGSYVEAIIHRLRGGIVRVAVAGIDDVIEYRLIREQWTSEMGVVVTFEFTPDVKKRMEAEAPCAVGGECVLRRMPGSGTGLVN